MLWLYLDLDELPALAQRLRWLSWNRFNLVSFHDRDHGAGTNVPLRTQIEHALSEAGLNPDGGVIRVLCMPRLLGTIFNPLSVFFCHRADGGLLAMLYEVNNTFGERHLYLIPVAEADSHRAVLRHCCDKRLHVSPFMGMAMTYHLRVALPAERAMVAIEGHDNQGPVIAAAYAGTRRELTDGALLRSLLRQPLLAMHVLGAIHWEALKLWRKGAPVHAKPPPPREPLSVVRDGASHEAVR
jgi:uncharacterized protein